MERITNFFESIYVPQRIDREKLMPIVSIATATTVLFASYKMISSSNHKRKMREQGLKKIPIPGSCYPYVGHMLSMGELPGKVVSKWHRELGPIINVKMGCQDWVIVDDPFLAHKIFVTNGADTSFRPYTTYSYEYYSFKGR
jgi:hypothetical protein